MTYSILVADPKNRLLGVISVSGSIAVGSRVPHINYPYCAVATQALTNPALGPIIGELVAEGKPAEVALRAALSQDSYFEHRQVAVITMTLDKAVFTGPETPAHRGEYIGEDFIVIGNYVQRKVVEVAAEAMHKNRKINMLDRLLLAAEEGHKAGGDLRGDRSAALLIYGETEYSPHYNKLLDLRVDFSRSPLQDLIKIVEFLK
ncbi:MAG: DUF1028 domain-containing protein [Thermoprotei archaeon]|nr:MAG: DUF1028 domain-containing protein [Thermoprotei archaeon]